MTADSEDRANHGSVRALTFPHEGEERFRLLLESAPDAIVIVDRTGRITIVNAQAEVMFGHARDDLLGRPIEMLLPEGLRAIHERHRAEYLAAPWTRAMGVGLDLVARRQDGSEFPVEVALSALGAGDSLQVISVVRDVTDHARREREVRFLQSITLAIGESPDLQSALGLVLRMVCEATGWILAEAWIPSPDGTVLDCSPAWHASEPGLEGFRAASERIKFPPGVGLPGRVWASMKPAWIRDVTRDPTFPRARWAEEAGLRAAVGIPVLADHEAIAVMDFFVRESREEDEALVELISAVAGQLGVVIRRKRAEDELRKLNAELQDRTAQLEAANRELEAFSYSVSHDLRAPLRAMDGFSRILVEKHGPELSGEARRYLGLVRNSARQMGELIDDLLTFSRLGRQELRKQRVSPAEVARTALDDLGAERAGRSADVTIADLPPCEGDPTLLKQVFENLLSNALKFTAHREVARIEVGSTREASETVYFVKDNGAGFDMRYANKLFGVFQRLHRAEDYPGTGVGLAIVQRIVHRHGGRVWAEAEPDEGATFYFTLRGRREG